MIVYVFMADSEDESGYIKAGVRDRNVAKMVSMGWSETPPEAPVSSDAPVAYVDDGDEGSGVPGTMQWHKVQIAQMETKEDVENYVKEACGQDIDKRGSLDTVKEKALAALDDGNG